MADGLFNLCGRRAAELKKDGRTYKLAIRTLADYALKEEAILSRTGNPYAGLDAIRDPGIRREALKVIADTLARPVIATMDDEDRFERSMRGLSWLIWRAMGTHHATEFPQDLPIERGIQLGADFIDWFGDIQGICRAVYLAEEKDIVKNSSGREAEAA